MATVTGGQLPQPRFGIGDVVFLRESAAIGFLEPYHVASIAFSATNEPVYTIQIEAKSGVTPTFGDRILKKGSIASFDSTSLRHLGRTISFLESELIALCEAAVLVRNNLTDRLERINVTIAEQCPEVQT